MEVGDHFGAEGVVEGNVVVAEEGLAEHAVAEEVHVLFHVEEVGGEGADSFFGVRTEAGGDHGGELGFAEVLEFFFGGAGDELVEVEGFVELFEMLVEEVGVGGALEEGEFLAKEDGVGGFGDGDGLGEEGEKGAGGLDAVVGVFEVLGVVPEHFADGGAGVPAGVGVVGDVGDAVGREIVFADVEDFGLHFGGHPGVDAVGEDVVELAEVGGEVEDGFVVEVDVGEF